MKVLLIDQIAKVNYKYTFPLANGLTKAGANILLIIDKKINKENCNCTRITLFNTSEKDIGKFSKLLNYISSYIKIGKILKTEKIDIIHTEWYNFSPIDYFFLNLYKRKYQLKYVATVHDIMPFNKTFYDKYFIERLYNLSDSIILQAPGNITRFTELFPNLKNKLHLIPHGHMLDYIEKVDKIKSRDRLEIPHDKIVFLFFGQIKKVKGVDILLKALIKLYEKYSELFVIIAGSIWKTDFTECQNLISQKDLSKCLKTDIRYIPDDEVKYYYSAADACVLPYIDVYQSGVIQLAYGYQKPVISSDLPAFTQFVKEEITGYISKAGDYESLANAIERAIINKNKLEELGFEGYNLVKNTLSWDILAKQIVDECYK